MPKPTFVPAQQEPGDMLWIRELLANDFSVDDITMGAMKGRAVRVRGHFLTDAQRAYKRLAPAFRERGRTLLMRREEGETSLFIVSGTIAPTPNKRWLPLALAVLTVISILITATLREVAELTWPNIVRGLGNGAAFTATLLAILVSHELGHYFTARHFGVAATLPYLIPFPLSPFGTMGAVIMMKDIPPSRRAMLLIGAAGPLAGLIVTLPLLVLGLSLSEVQPLPSAGGYVMEGNSILYGLIKLLMFGRWLPQGGIDVMLHPVAYAGWAGLLVTSLNLIPAGQLDGGHAAYALLGAKSKYLTWAMIAVLIPMGLVWNGWLLWAALIYLFSRTRAGPMDDVSPLTSLEMGIAIALLLLFGLTFTPLPLRLVV